MAGSSPTRTTSPRAGCTSTSKQRLGHRVKLLNDAALQALGSFQQGLLLFLGLGTGLGSAIVADGVVVPLELAHLPYSKGSYEDYVGIRGLKRLGKKKWRRHVAFIVARMMEVLHPDDIVLGGGNAKKLDELPPNCRLGANALAFQGGFRLWEDDGERQRLTLAKTGTP